MAFSACSAHPRIYFQICSTSQTPCYQRNLVVDQRWTLSLQCSTTDIHRQHISARLTRLCSSWTLLGSQSITLMTKTGRFISPKKKFKIRSCLAGSQLASGAFTLGTVAVLPFYTLMVVAPNSELTKKTMCSTIPYVILGLLYAYLLYLSWTPETIRLMFASKYWLPELPGIAKMFAREMTLASAWIHLLVVDLFAARQIYQDGLENGIETRHSVSFCLLFCPIGIVSHIITKALSKPVGRT